MTYRQTSRPDSVYDGVQVVVGLDIHTSHQRVEWIRPRVRLSAER